MLHSNVARLVAGAQVEKAEATRPEDYHLIIEELQKQVCSWLSSLHSAALPYVDSSTRARRQLGGTEMVDRQVEKALWATYSGRGLAVWQYVVQGRKAFEDAVTHGCWEFCNGGWVRGPRPDLHSANAEGWTALHIAADAGNVDAIKLLLEHGADVNCCDGKGRTAAYHAAANGNVDALLELERRGARLDYCDIDGVDAAHRAAVRACLYSAWC
eukprot:SAG31_NODE_2502_length_5594_cov_3.175796_7_plen_214_part_00